MRDIEGFVCDDVASEIYELYNTFCREAQVYLDKSLNFWRTGDFHLMCEQIDTLIEDVKLSREDLGIIQNWSYRLSLFTDKGYFISENLEDVYSFEDFVSTPGMTHIVDNLIFVAENLKGYIVLPKDTPLFKYGKPMENVKLIYHGDSIYQFKRRTLIKEYKDIDVYDLKTDFNNDYI